MKLEQFSENQKKCILDRDKSLLVSAAAGSGKTAVLVERIFQLIKEGRASISDMLIVTFTNAAASEMKEKIREKLYEESKDEKDAKAKSRLRTEYSLVETANISTFHVFYLDVIKNFFYIKNYEPNLKFGDQLQLDRMSDEALEELVTKYFDEENKEFLFFVDQYCDVADYSYFKNLVKELYTKVVTFREGIGFFDIAKTALINYEKDYKNSDLYKSINISKDCRNLEKLIPMLDKIGEKVIDGNPYKEAVEKDKELISTLIDGIKQLSIPKVTWTNGPSNSKDKYTGFDQELHDALEKVSKKRNSFVQETKKFFELLDEYENINYLIECTSNCPTYKNGELGNYHIFDFIKQAVIDYEKLLKEKKNDAGIISFDDSERMAYELLKEESGESGSPREYYQNKFKYIFVDEYQDESDIQNAIIERLANNEGNNLFLVGDIKQSIYRFRNSEPGLFLDRINEFSDGKDNHQVFSLNENYRSKGKVVDFVNSIFREIMPEEYKKSDELVAKCEDYDTEDSNAELWVLNKEEFDDLDEELLDLKTIELESKYIVKAIKEHLGKPYRERGKDVQYIDYKDIVILLRTVKGKGDVIYKALKEAGIPAFLTNDEGYYESIEISTFIDVLKVIDNYKQDVELISALRSTIFNFTFDDLADIRICTPNKEVPFYDAFYNYLKVGTDEELKNKVQIAIDKINNYKKMSKQLPIDDFIWQLMLDENYYLEMGALNDGARRQANLRSFVDMARKYRTSFDNSLAGFIEYTKLNIKKQLNSAQVKMKSENDNVVRIMSVHKSKGLEFPFVIIPDAAKAKDGGNTINVQINRKLGIGLKVQDRNRLLKNDSAFSAIIKRVNEAEELQEKKHLFYVGLTRAKDYLLVIGTTNGMDKIKDESFLGMIYERVPNNTKINPELETEFHKEKEKAKNEHYDIKSYIDGVDVEYEESDYSFDYSNKEAQRVHSKYSVSELNKINQEENKSFNSSFKKKEEKREELSPAEIGSIVHKFIEKMDFNDALENKEEYIDNLKSDLISKEILLEKEIKAIENDKIMKFVNSDIFNRAAKSNKLYKEKNFIMNIEVSGVKTLCQGTIDCFFIEDDGAVLIDYKTSSHNNIEKLKNDYSEQIRIYKKAIEDGFNIVVKEAYLYLSNYGELVKMD